MVLTVYRVNRNGAIVLSNKACDAYGRTHVDRVGLVQVRLRNVINQGIRLYLPLAAILNDGRGSTVNATDAVSYHDQDVLRGFSKLCVVEVRRVSKDSCLRAIRCVR